MLSNHGNQYCVKENQHVCLYYIELRPRLEEAKRDVNIVEKTNQKTEDKLTDVLLELD